MTRGTALVATVARVVQLTGQTTLAGLELDGELTLTEFLVTASDVIYDRLEADGIDPTTLSNAEVYERAVAYQLLAQLAALGHLTDDGEQAAAPYDRFTALCDRFYEQVKPKQTGRDDPSRTAGGIPGVANVTCRPIYGGSSFTTDFPRQR